MSRFRLSPVEPVALGVHESAWEQPYQRQRREPKYAARRRLLQAVAPDRDPDTCELFAEFDPAGELLMVIVRDTASGEVLAQLTRAQFELLTAEGEQRGLLFERRG